MDAMQDLYLQKLVRWQNFMEVFSLPGWEELPPRKTQSGS